MDYQKTIKKTIRFEGVGLHTGKMAQVTLKPASENSGIVFVRTDVSKKVIIPALSQYVVDTTLSTTLGKDGVTIATVEHLMAAVWGLSIDNLEIEISGPEVPIMDGSSLFFVKKLKKSGIIEQDYYKKVLVITKPTSVVMGDRYCYLLSSKAPKITCSIEFDHPAIKKQKFELTLNGKSFSEKIAPARTFGFMKNFEALRQKGLIAGGSLDNAIVLDEERVLNKEGLRFKDEFVRHKILDTLGDLSLLGIPVIGHWVSHKAGHELHYQLLRKVLIEKAGYILGASEQESDSAVSEQYPLFQSVSA